MVQQGRQTYADLIPLEYRSEAPEGRQLDLTAASVDMLPCGLDALRGRWVTMVRNLTTPSLQVTAAHEEPTALPLDESVHHSWATSAGTTLATLARESQTQHRVLVDILQRIAR